MSFENNSTAIQNASNEHSLNLRWKYWLQDQPWSAPIIKDLFFNEIDSLTVDINKETSLYMISLIAQLKDN